MTFKSAPSRYMRRLASFRLTAACRLHVQVGDLTTFEGDAIVNAANEAMLGGGGVDGAIHRAAGPDLLRACRQVPVHKRKRCPTGEARITPGFRLPAKHVIHTVGPVFVDHETSQPLLASAFRSSLQLANRPEHHIREIAFPAISCGVYGYPVERAAEVAVRECQQHAGALTAISLVLFSNPTAEPFLRAAQAQLGEQLPEDSSSAGTL